VAAAAEAAHWRLPATVTIAVWREAERAPVLPADALHNTIEGLACCVLAGPPRELLATLAGRPAGIGPAVALGDAARSFRLACAVLALAEERGETKPLAVDAHRVELMWRTEPSLVAALAAERLAPLGGETPGSRTRLQATLLAWLRHAGNVGEAAAELGVHPQTVRYRLGRLRELFGTALDDPDARFELELVLRAR
jgi:DNA-binding PucR family transcriptional regulator